MVRAVHDLCHGRRSALHDLGEVRLGRGIDALYEDVEPDRSEHELARWALTNSVRLELADQRTLVTGLHLGAADTDMMAWYDGDKTAPEAIVAAALDGIEAHRSDGQDGTDRLRPPRPPRLRHSRGMTSIGTKSPESSPRSRSSSASSSSKASAAGGWAARRRVPRRAAAGLVSRPHGSETNV
ncbi:hypothetical protein ACFYTU_45570 [Nonomuraea angiospora]|uniref:hypothetical protein n=1 Tax=Nonomuraea angiospora TaxID=46172 RepID=UPI0036A65335